LSPGKRRKEKIMKNIRRLFHGHQKFLIGDMRRGRFVCDKGQLEVVDDAIDDGEIGRKNPYSFSKRDLY